MVQPGELPGGSEVHNQVGLQRPLASVLGVSRRCFGASWSPKAFCCFGASLGSLASAGSCFGWGLASGASVGVGGSRLGGAFSGVGLLSVAPRV